MKKLRPYFFYASISMFSFAYAMEEVEPIPNTNVMTGIIYNIKHRASDAHLDANGKGTEVYMLGNADRNNHYQQWSLVRAEDNFYNIKHRFSGSHLDANGNGTKVYMLGNAERDNHCQQWSLVRAEDNFYNIKHRYSGAHLDANGKGTEVYMFGNAQINNIYQQWSFIPASYELIATIRDFKYPEALEKAAHHQKQVSLVEKRLISNHSSAEVIETVTATKSMVNTFSYGFKESFKCFAKTELKAGIPLLVSGKVELGMEFSFEANQQVTTQTSETYTLSRQIKVPPHQSVEVFGYVNFVDNLEIPFTATARITGLSDYLQQNGRIQHDHVNADAIKNFLKFNNFKGRVVGIEGTTVLAEVSGIFSGSYGLDSGLSLRDCK